jgi:GH24 family phage-related lysozyme (muramidase)
MNFTALHELKYHEGVRKKPYLDSVLLWTTGVGHLIAPKEHMEMTFVQRKEAKAAGLLKCPAEWDRSLTNAEVDEILTADLGRFERGVLRLCPGGLTQGRYNALVSFAFNAGLGRLKSSSIRARHNRGDFDGASDAFLLYRMAGGMVQKGLETRRKDERAMYLGG